MKVTKLLGLCAILTASYAGAQQTYIDKSGGLDYMYSKKAPSEPAEGSQYFIEKFNPARIDDSNDIALVRYNAYSDEMELKINDEIVVLDPKEDMLIKLVNNQADYKFVQYTNKDGYSSQSYLVLVSDNDKIKIFRKERIELEPEEHPQGGYQKYKAPRYKKLNDQYYVQMNNGDVVYMSDSKRDIRELIPGKEKEIKNFMKEYRIKVSDDQDLKQLGSYLNTLL